MRLLKNYFPFLFIPLLIVGWGLFNINLFYPYYTWAIDPEMPYLVNGLNAALLKFDRIGHFDHPGTPFQLFNGLVIRLAHLINGQGSMTEDVFNRPEFYLKAISLTLTLLCALLTLLAAVEGKKRGMATTSLLMMQGGLLLSNLLINIFSRAIPERWFLIATGLFVITFIRYGYKNRNPLKFAIFSGLTLAMGLATKFNYLPVLLLPLFISRSMKHRLIYGISAMASFFIFILPVINRFKEYRSFITSVATHDGIYGQGEARMFNPEAMAESFQVILNETHGLIVWISMIVAGLLLAVVYRKRGDNVDYAKMFAGFLLVYAAQIIMVAKHFKPVYMAPLHGLYGFFFLTISLFAYNHFSKKWWVFVPIVLVFAGLAWKNLDRVQYDMRYTLRYLDERAEVMTFVQNHMPDDATWFVEPTWMSGPHKENAIIFGLSYSRQRHLYLPQLMKVNPNVITFEGSAEEVKQWRAAPASLDSIVGAGRHIYVFDTPGRHGGILIDMAMQAAARQQTDLAVDTVFSQAETETTILRITKAQSYLTGND